jgi:hypothetical protein
MLTRTKGATMVELNVGYSASTQASEVHLVGILFESRSEGSIAKVLR